MYRLIIIIFYFLIVSCSNTSNQEINAKDFYKLNKATTSINKSSNELKKLSIKPLKLEDSIESSFIGNIQIYNDTIYFNDQNFGYVFKFDSSGNFLSREIGMGRGPNEVTGMSYFTKTDTSYVGIYNGNSYIYTFDEQFNKKEEGQADWKLSRSREEMLTKPIPSLGDIYEFDWDIPNILQPWDENHVAVAITASHPMFNAYFDTDLYYNYSRFLAIINIKNQVVEKIFGRRSPLYLENKNLPNFDHFNYETTEDDVFVNFWIDPNIYIIDKDEETVKSTFGVPGKDMIQDYVKTNSYEEAEKRRILDRSQYGYYHYLKIFNEDSLVVRGYKRGGSSETDGLQIYQDQKLIGDFDIQTGLKVIGKLDDTLIAMPDNFDNGLTLYKIELNE